jgi:hypothetical protein
MDHTPVVRVLERCGDRRRDAHGFFDRKLLLPIDSLAERLALHIGHDIIEEAVRLPGVEERQDVGVLQVGGGLDLREEPLRAHDGRQLRLEDLERDPPLVFDVVGEVDGGHPALAELPLYSVAPLQGLVEALDRGLTHGRAPGVRGPRVRSVKGATRIVGGKEDGNIPSRGVAGNTPGGSVGRSG